MHRNCWHCQGPRLFLASTRRPRSLGHLASELKAQRDSQAAKPTRILTSKHQQEALSGKQVRARFTESQSSFPSSLHGSSSTGSRPAQHNARQQHQQDDQPQQSARRHAAFSDFAVVQPYSILMFAWSVCLICTGRWLGCWGGALAAMLWFAASGSRYSSRMGQPSTGSTVLSLILTAASSNLCFFLKRSAGAAGAGLLLATSLAAAASLVYNLVSGGNPTISSPTSAKADASEQASSMPAPPSSDGRPQTGRRSRSAEGSQKASFWRRWGKAEDAQHGAFPTDEADKALLQASSAAVSESVGDSLSPAEAKAVELAIAAGLKQQLPKAIEGVFMDPDMNMRFDVTANVNTLVALIGVIAFWRGVWTLWDVGLGDSFGSEIGGIVLGLVIMAIIRWRKLPLAEGLPGV